MRRIRLTILLFAAVAFSGGVFAVAPAARAQGTLTAPAGQKRVTAPGGLRGRAAMHRHRMHRMHRRHR